MGPSRETSAGYDPTEEGEEKEGAREIRGEISIIRNNCEHVYSDPDNGEMLEQLFKDAEENYDVDRAGWEKLLKSTKDKLLKEDESDRITEILREALTESTAELM